jgi:hypothetical protein
MKMRWILLLAGLCLASSCGSDAPGSGKTPAPYFDLKVYMEGEIRRLDAEQPRVVKKVQFNGQEETMQPPSLNYAEELRIFLDSDINRPAWRGMYDCDTIVSGESAFRVRYVAREKSPLVRLLTINYEEDEITEIGVERSSKTLLLGSSQVLNYQSGSGFSIRTVQQALMRKDQTIYIAVDMAAAGLQ